jgi:hypothetical protein
MGPGAHGHGHPGGPGWHGDPAWHGTPGWHGTHGWPGGPGFDGIPGWWEWWPLLPSLALAALVMTGVVLLSQRGAALLNQVPLLSGPTSFGPDPASWWPGRWEQAVQRYRATAQAYAEFECDLQALLRLPALADVEQPATARFVDAFAEANALRTEQFPGPAYAQRFAGAVERAEQAWRAAVDAAEHKRDARFAPSERRLIAKVQTLLEVAASSRYESERRTAYQQAQRRLAELARRTGWRLPRRAAEELDHRARGMLEAAGT